MQSEILNPQSAVPYHFCTYFDRNYLYKGLALYRSLARHCDVFTLWVLCFDQVTHDVLREMDLPGLRLIARTEFEKGDDALLAAQTDRTLVEYYWTCTPSLPLYILQNNPEIDVIGYLDADIFFYADPIPIYDELGNQSILIIGHRYRPEIEHLVKYGIYNVGFLLFRHNDIGLQCLRWWRERCLEWCYNRLEDGKMGDQKYLDDWPQRFEEVIVLQYKGGGVGPWNIANYELRCSDGQLWVDEVPLVFYHFHRFYILNSWVFEPDGSQFGLRRTHFSLLYEPYITELRQSMREVLRVMPDFRGGFTSYSVREWIRRVKERRLLYSLGSTMLR